jgi:phosphoglycerate dehydrogenase-like enzyme
MADLDTVLREADFVVLLLPLNSETYRLIDEAALRKMKPTANLINIARGAITDEQALAAALREGRLAGAAIDTFKEIDIFAGVEAPPQHPLLELDNVILTPHISSLSAQSMNEVSIIGVGNMATVLAGHWPHPDHIVNRGVVPWMPLADYDPTLLERLAPGT